jgi:CBS-domain-containing membrane protein
MTTAQQLLAENQKLIVLRPEDTLAASLTRLTEQNISSAPVVSGDNKVVGVVDLLDLVEELLQSAGVPTALNLTCESRPVPVVLAADGSTANRLREKQTSFNQTTIREVLASRATGTGPRRNTFATASLTTPLAELAKAAATGVSRFPVVADDGKIVGMLSQIDVVTHLTAFARDRFAGNASRTCEELGLCKHVFSITDTTRALEAFIFLNWISVSGLAVVDAAGRLMSQISVSDLKLLARHPWDVLLLPVRDFLALHPKPRTLTTLTPTTTLAELTQMFATTRAHRILLIDVHGKPVGLASLTDVLAHVV